MLLVEGPDMVGKTMLCAELHRRMREQEPRVVRDKFGLPESTCMLDECRSRMRENVICDRCWLSEIVYGYTIRGRPSISPKDSAECERLFRSVGGFLVVVTADPACYDRLVAEHHSRGEAFTAEQCREVNAAYRDGFDGGRLGAYRLPKPDVHLHMRLREDGTVRYPGEDSMMVDLIGSLYLRRT